MRQSEKIDGLQISFLTDELLGYWEVNTDHLWLSRGARAALNLAESEECLGMGDFLAHVAPASLPSLTELREGVLSGVAGSCVETVYHFGRLQVRECLVVLERGADNRAVHVLAQYAVTGEGTSLNAISGYIEDVSGEGLWMLDLASGMVRRDAVCNRLLGLAAVPTCIPVESAPGNMHVDDEKKLLQNYLFMIEKSANCSHLEHTIRLKLPGGAYRALVLRGSVLGRDENGVATHIGGTLRVPAPLEARHDLTFQDSRRLLFAVNSTGDGLWDWDAVTDSVYYSPRYLSMLGYTSDEFPASLEAWKTKIHPDDHDKIVTPQRELADSPRYGETFECTYRIMRKDGSWAWILGRGYVTHRDEQGRATRIVGMHTDITAVQSEREKLEDMVRNDTLTGLRSRAFCDLEMKRIESSKVRPVCVFSMNITGLKLINDTLGHASGDNLLAEAALLLREPLRAMDCVARMGGDEFVVLLPGCTPENGRRLMRRIQRCFEEHNTQSGCVPIHAAFGMAATASPVMPVADLLRKADGAMRLNKKTHRAAVHRAIKEWIERADYTS